MKTATLSVDLLRLDAGTQCRVSINEETVEDYAELILNSNGEWPLGSIVVFHDGSEYFVADGFHRTLAANRAKRGSVPCDVHAGTATDARIFGMTANDRHGLRMTRADKRSCVEWLLDQKCKRTQTEVADIAGVSRRTVAMIVADRKPKIVQTSQTSEGVSSFEAKQTPTTPSDADAAAGGGGAAAETGEFQDKTLVVCPHCQVDLTANSTFSEHEQIVFGDYLCPECDGYFQIGPGQDDSGSWYGIAITPLAPIASPAPDQEPPAAEGSSVLCPLCESDQTAFIPKSGGGLFIPSVYECEECGEPFQVAYDENSRLAVQDYRDPRGAATAYQVGEPDANVVAYATPVDDDGETFRTTMPPLDLSAGPVDPPDLGDFETMKIGWRLHVQPIWMASDDANRRAMRDWVEQL